MKRQTGESALSELLDVTGANTTSNVRVVNGFNLPPFDAFQVVDTSTTEDTVEYYVGGLGGTLVATTLITYTSTAKTAVLNAAVSIV